MKKTYLNELTNEELKTLFRKNEHLQKLANDLHQENIMFWIGEELKVFKDALFDWSIGFYYNNYIKVKDSSLFIKNYKNYIDVYSSDDQTIELVNEAHDYLLNNYEDDDYDEKIEEFADKLKTRLIAYLDKCTTDSEDENELIEYLDNNDILMNYYIMDDKSFIVYEDITKSYR